MKSAKCFCKASVSFFTIHHALKLPVLILFLAIYNSGYISAADSENGPVLPPVAVCKNITVQLGTGGTAAITASDIDAGSYDPDGNITSMVVTPNLFNCSQKGPNSVVLTVTDDEGKTASCSAIVTVEDKLVPTVSCRNFTLYLDATGKATLNVSDIDNGSTDNCSSGLFFYLSRTDFSCNDTGSPVIVTLVGTDASGNSSTCTSQITVLDTISPVINFKAFTLVLGSAGTATLNASDIDNGSFDNCGGVALSVSPSVFTCNDLGEQIVGLSATDSYGNTSKKYIPVTISSTLEISGMSLSSCDMAPTIALFEADIQGGDGNYSYLWKGVNPTSLPFMVIIPFPPSLLFSHISVLETPFFNNTMPNGYYSIRLTATDGNGCRDSSEIKINKTGAIFDNQTMRRSEACEGEAQIYSVNYKPEAIYSWSVENGTILNSDTDTSRISILWDLGVVEGRVSTTITKPNSLFPGGTCESVVTDTVTINPIPLPAFNNPATDVCYNVPVTYTLTGSYAYNYWSVTGGIIVAGGTISDNYVTVIWNSYPSGGVSVSSGNYQNCLGSVLINVNIFKLTGTLISLSDISCNGGSDGSVTVSADSGTGMAPYIFSLDGGPLQATGTFSGISLGNHFVRITDALLCTYDIPFIINQPAPVTGIPAAVNNVSCFGGSDGSVTVTASGGTPPYQYRLNGGALQSSNIFNGLAAGSYTITIEDSHACTGYVLLSVLQPVTPLSGVITVTSVACYGESTGRLDLTASGGTEPYTYLWSTGSVLKDQINLPAGTYNVIITDASGCTLTLSANITQPVAAISGNISVTNVLCFGESTGSANLTVTGGTAPYSFQWNTGAVTKDLSGIPAGNYSVIITDSNGCILNLNTMVSQPSLPLSGSVTSNVSVSCFGGNDASVTVAGSGGNGPYEYRIGSGPYQASGIFGSLNEGIYSITVRDANLCTYVLSVTVTQPASALSGSVTSQTNVDCYGNATGELTLVGSGGTPPYEYSFDGDPFQSSGLFYGLPAGNYNVIVRDVNMCSFGFSVTVTQPSQPLSVSVNNTDNLCVGASTGSATANPSGGTLPYTYLWSTVPSQSVQTATGLPAGSYSVIVTDSNGCTISGSATISEPSAAIAANVEVTDATCNGDSDGSIDLTVTNGTAPFSFSWSNGAVTEDVNGVQAGDYNVTVTDVNGCIASASATVGQPSELTGSIAVTDAGCFGESTGSANLTVNGATPPYSFAWSTGAVSEDLDNQPAGDYSVTVTDSHGCTSEFFATVNQPSTALAGTILTISNVTVYGGNDGSITIGGSGGTSPYLYSLNNATYESSATFGSLTAGYYTVSVMDANLCLFELEVTITQPWIPLTAHIISQTDIKCNGGNEGSITVEGWGGTSPYMYSLNGGPYQESGTFSSLSAGSYTIYVRDGISDVFYQPFTITESPTLDLIVNGSDPQCYEGTNGSATAFPSGGTEPYSFVWSTNPEQNTATATGLSAGSYTVTVSDINGCSATGTVNLSQPDSELLLEILKTDVICSGGTTGSASVSVTGGLAPYSYSWDTDPVQTTSSATGLAAGDYTVDVTDSYGCIKTATVTIVVLQSMSVSTTVIEASCPDSKDGSVSISISGGTSPYSIFWSDGSTLQNRSDLGPGTYDIVVTDQNGCAESVSVEVDSGFSFACLVIPQVITPNGDGFNDEWIIKNIGFYPDAEVHIFNRWGQEVFYTKNLADNPWDGRSKGKLVPTDSYHYILYLNDGSEPRTGVISVIR